jgi:hypothetical protein
MKRNAVVHARSRSSTYMSLPRNLLATIPFEETKVLGPHSAHADASWGSIEGYLGRKMSPEARIHWRWGDLPVIAATVRKTIGKR